MEFENKNIEITGKGIKLSVLSGVFIGIGVIIMVVSFFLIKKTYVHFDEMRQSYQAVEMERKAAISFQEASDYLTESSREFVANGEITYAQDYFFEKDEVKRRETAKETIDRRHTLELEAEMLGDAMAQSNSLVEYELHAMYLAAIVNKIDPASIAEELAAYSLPEEEKTLSKDEQQMLAIELLYGEGYETMKGRINWDVKNTIELIEEEAVSELNTNEDALILSLNVATLLIFLLFILLVLLFICVILLVVKPANRFIEALDNKEKLPEVGAYEFRKVARRYNTIYRSDKKNRELLREQGEVDDVTGLLKVGTLDLVRHNLTKSGEKLGIMMVDIDNFRSVKEASGYDMADRVVAKVAKYFTKYFKSSDYIIRTSQDEFELFLLHMTQEDASMLEERIAHINEKLQDTEDGVPAVSVSAGVAFSEDGFAVEVERAADMALNYVKENGRGYCKVAES